MIENVAKNARDQIIHTGDIVLVANHSIEVGIVRWFEDLLSPWQSVETSIPPRNMYYGKMFYLYTYFTHGEIRANKSWMRCRGHVLKINNPFTLLEFGIEIDHINGLAKVQADLAAGLYDNKKKKKND